MDDEVTARIVLAVVMVASGVLLIWMARATASGRLKRNQIAGIRIPSTMVSEEAWLAAHRRAERPTIWAGVWSAASGVAALLPIPIALVVVAILAASAAMITHMVYGARVGSRAAQAAGQ